MPPRDSSGLTNGLYVSQEQAIRERIYDKEDIVAERRITEAGLKPVIDNKKNDDQKSTQYKVQLKWLNICVILAWHIGSFHALQLMFCGEVQWKTIAFAYLLYVLSGLGVTAGVHRLWSHRSYKAKWPLRLLLAVFNTTAYENSIYEWARDHRVHHKFSETDADPHDARRGFFFSHVGWLMCKKHPEVIAKGKLLDYSDLMADPIVRYQHQYYIPLVAFFCFVLPTMLPHYLWDESFYNAFYVCAIFRYCFLLHATWLVNSAAHFWGRRPYDATMNPAENPTVSCFALGEGFHNYHHTFPWDYATSELGYKFNLSKIFIDAMAAIGWAYDRKVVSPDQIKQRKYRTGDVSEKGAYGPHN
ncbi:Acyl-CoA desaturase, partial [Fragariocoptes setiger]